MAVLVAIVGVPLVLLLFTALGVLVNAWEAWWLYPFWAQIMVPLGLPQISFWMFFALCMFVAAIIQRTAYADHLATKKAENDEFASAAVSVYLSKLLTPVVAWLILKWALS